MSNRYQAEPYLRELQTTIKCVFEEDGKNCVLLTDNIFHPHGGGQKGDRGELRADGQTFKIINTVKDKEVADGALLFSETLLPDEMQGQPVTAVIDWDLRFKRMRLHTALHLHHCMMERVNGASVPHPKTADVEDDFAFNRYETPVVSEELVTKATTEFLNVIKQGAEINRFTDPDPDKKGFWWWECLGFRIPCGGTHVKNANEIGNVNVECYTKRGMPSVKITLI